ncbi:hypothetical protein ACMD2_26485, partial [Ananas comosus]
ALKSGLLPFLLRGGSPYQTLGSFPTPKTRAYSSCLLVGQPDPRRQPRYFRCFLVPRVLFLPQNKTPRPSPPSSSEAITAPCSPPAEKMIKRRFYKQDHDGDKGGSSSSDSDSDSDSDSARDTTTKEEEEEEEEAEEGGDELKDEGEQEAQEEEGEQERDGDQRPFSPSPGSGYESEDSSENVLDGNCSGSAVDEEDGFDSGRGNHQNRPFIRNIRDGESICLDAARNSPNINDPSDTDFASFILKCKSVFKCRLCPRIICLSEETVKAHLASKRHARSKKLLGEGRLKLMLNSDGELEEDQETHAERHARTIALAQRLRNHSEKQAEGPMNDHIKRRCKAEERKIK